jgi:hypothetical protein
MILSCPSRYPRSMIYGASMAQSRFFEAFTIYSEQRVKGCLL